MLDKILATWQPQHWIFDNAVDSGPPITIDVTHEVLKLPLAEIKRLQDNRDSTDELVLFSKNLPEEVLSHNGPSYVTVVDSVCAFFKVRTLLEITQGHLDTLRPA